ncbi:unknown [Alistipes finegoldii CAG:68]|nr:unknown [Alistipes finegoldii CAG:68]
MAAGVEAVFGVVFDAPAVADQHRTCGQRRAVTAGDAGVLGRVAAENVHFAAAFVAQSDDAVGAHRLTGSRPAQNLLVDQYEGYGGERLHVEVAAVQGGVGSGGFAQLARGACFAVELYDLRREITGGVGDHRDGLPRIEHVDLGAAAFGARREGRDLPAGAGESDRVFGCLGCGRKRKEEQEGSRKEFNHGLGRIDGYKFKNLNRFAKLRPPSGRVKNPRPFRDRGYALAA